MASDYQVAIYTFTKEFACVAINHYWGKYKNGAEFMKSKTGDWREIFHDGYGHYWPRYYDEPNWQQMWEEYSHLYVNYGHHYFSRPQ